MSKYTANATAAPSIEHYRPVRLLSLKREGAQRGSADIRAGWLRLTLHVIRCDADSTAIVLSPPIAIPCKVIDEITRLISVAWEGHNK